SSTASSILLPPRSTPIRNVIVLSRAPCKVQTDGESSRPLPVSIAPRSRYTDTKYRTPPTDATAPAAENRGSPEAPDAPPGFQTTRFQKHGGEAHARHPARLREARPRRRRARRQGGARQVRRGLPP